MELQQKQDERAAPLLLGDTVRTELLLPMGNLECVQTLALNRIKEFEDFSSREVMPVFVQNRLHAFAL
jgi:hypothetical protein